MIDLRGHYKVGHEVWLAGKGPSLTTYNWNKAGEYRFGINHSFKLIPDCLGTFTADPPAIKEMERIGHDDKIIFLSRRFKKDYDFKYVYGYSKGREVFRIGATASMAIQILKYLGAEKIHFVGFDSFKGNFSRCKDIIPYVEGKPNLQSYKLYIPTIKQIIQECEIKAVWHF